MKKIFWIFFLIPFFTSAQELRIIPQPAVVKLPPVKGSFLINASTQIILEGSGLENSVAFFNSYLQEFYGFQLKTAQNVSGTNVIRLNYERMDDSIPGSYRMTVDNKGVYLAGDNAEGIFYGIQTLIQLLPVPTPDPKKNPANLAIAYLQIEDRPRFAYRGLHLDVCRHFFPINFLKKYIDYIALHKMNFFHWHLTEDQGWRIEIKKYPGLTQKGAWRNGTIKGRYPGQGNDNIRYGGYYTQEQVKEIVQYAADRYITVIPEIEMPGHSSAAIASYPFLSCFPEEPTKIPAHIISSESRQQQAKGEKKLVQETWGVFEDVFCAGKEQTFEFLEDVIDEVIALFPSQYFHVGGDECPKANWKRCPQCQKRMKDNKLKDEHELQSYFIQRMEKYLNGKGKTLIGWDEILEGGLAPNAIVMSWRGEEGGIAAAKENHKVIMTPGSHVYLDHSQSENEDSVTIGGFTTVEKVYSYEPVPAVLNKDQVKYVMGAQGNVWTEYMKNHSKIEYMIFPRMSALSEVLWSPKEKKQWNNFEKRLMVQFERYKLWNANYSKAYFDLKSTIVPAPGNNGVLWKLETRLKDLKINYGLNTQSSEHTYKEPVRITKTGTYAARLSAVDHKIINSISQKFNFNKATGKKISLSNEPSKNYPGDGAFTLVNAVQNDKGRARSKEFLGFSGTDCEAVIDLGSPQTISSVIVHCFRQEGAWIYPPRTVEVFSSKDGKSFTSFGSTDGFDEIKNGNGKTKIEFKSVSTRFVKVVIKNWGIIPEGNPGAGNKAWLFVDEIEVW